ncbi:MAG: sigma-70 family RNA polymerase sigma factor [Verrucomicrobia bacterium]|nr:sigma-70 family RNA polymerase sigma factor [Verrucomicrobiota bacterium]
MLIDDFDTLDTLRRLVRQLSSDATAQEDLLQEALIHLWLREACRPGQRRSWYLRSCWLHLHNLLRSGRSVDCPKHRPACCVGGPGDGSGSETSEDAHAEAAIFSEVSAHEIISLVSPWLTTGEKRVLSDLAEGLTTREIARRLHVSHTAVIKRRRRIAALALKLGIAPPPKVSPGLNGHPRRPHWQAAG